MLTSDIENFPGYPEGIGGPEMMMQLREQAERFGLEVQDRNVERVDMSERPFKVYTEGEEFLTHSIIVSTGAESIWLGAEGEEEQKGRGISTCATCDGVNATDCLTCPSTGTKYFTTTNECVSACPTGVLEFLEQDGTLKCFN